MVRTYGPNRECPRNFDFLTYFFTRADFPTPVQVPLEIGDRKNILMIISTSLKELHQEHAG